MIPISIREALIVCFVACVIGPLALPDTGVAGTLDAPNIPSQVRVGGVGIKGGIINMGIINVNGYEHNPGPSVTFGVFFNIHLVGKFMVSPTVDLHNIHIYDTDEFLGDFSLGLKYMHYIPRSGIAVRPGVYFGLGHLGPWEVMTQSTNYLMIKASTEVLLFSRARYAWVIDVGFTYGKGGNSAYDISINPSLTVRVGFEY
ncbi:MAG: hypothetical protein KOO62_11575 [candidate division Zixibacteria bacterium]|nr:hypothetical protein [candidate division Zixibacteria bacterium]